MKKIGILLLIICCLLQHVPMYAAGTETELPTEITQPSETFDAENNSAIASGSFSLDALNPLLGTDKIVENARSAIVYEANSQTLMYAWNADAQMYPASLTKIMTALLAVEKGNLEDTVTVSETAISAIPADAVSAKLVAEEKILLQDLLYCLLLGSANDAAAVIAEHISGSQRAFVDEMNQYALELGCNATHFTNAHGLHDDNQHTTARDSAKILDAALKNPVFKTIFTATKYTVQPTNVSLERVLSTGNSMMDNSSKLYYDARVIGGRTGVTKDGRRCLATAAESNGMLVICVVMGADSVYQEDGYTAVSIGGYKETTKLFNACLDGYKTVELLRAEQILRQIPIHGADNDLLIAPETSVRTILPIETTLSDLTFHYADGNMTLPIRKGQHISDVQIWLGATCVAQSKLIAMNTLQNTEDIVTTNQTAPKQPKSTGLWIILVVVVCVAVVTLSIRFSNRIRDFLTKLHAKRYRNSRKRMK